MRRFRISSVRMGRASLLAAVFLAGLVAGAALTATAQQQEQPGIEDLIFGRAEAYLLSLHNIVVSLSVDTERAAIGIARLESRLGKLERRLAAMERSEPAQQ